MFARVRPEEKADKVRQLQGDGYAVAMVGDGVNDATALAQADLGMAAGSGTDAAIAAADLPLVNGDPNTIAEALLLARATPTVIRGNLRVQRDRDPGRRARLPQPAVRRDRHGRQLADRHREQPATALLSVWVVTGGTGNIVPVRIQISQAAVPMRGYPGATAAPSGPAGTVLTIVNPTAAADELIAVRSPVGAHRAPAPHRAGGPGHGGRRADDPGEVVAAWTPGERGARSPIYLAYTSHRPRMYPGGDSGVTVLGNRRSCLPLSQRQHRIPH